MSSQSKTIVTEDEKHQFEQLMLRMLLPLYVILKSIQDTLGPMSEVERESDCLLSSLPRIDRQTLEQSQECPICDKMFSSPAAIAPTRAVNPTPLQLPCSHIICEGCLETWLSKAGSCPMCRCTLTSRVFQGGDSVVDIRSEVRAIFRKVLHFGQLYLETIPSDDTFGGMWSWGRKAQSEEQRQAWKAMKQFQNYTTPLENHLLSTENVKAILARAWEAYGLRLIYPERAQRLEQNENVSLTNRVAEYWEVVDTEHEEGEGEVVDYGEGAWETDESQTDEDEVD